MWEECLTHQDWNKWTARDYCDGVTWGHVTVDDWTDREHPEFGRRDDYVTSPAATADRKQTNQNNHQLNVIRWQIILQNVSLFSVWILNPRSFFKIHWNDDEFYFAFFFYFLLFNVTIDGRLMQFGHFFELCTARPLNGNCSARRHVSSYRSTSRNDLHRLRRWKCLVCASIRGTRSRHRDWRRSFLLSQSLVIIKMFISVWSFSFMQIQKSDDDDCWWMFCIWWNKKRARQFCPV